jgi:hypothetical protein
MPVSKTVCGESLALSVMVTVPVRDPLVIGVNVTEMEQSAPTATLDPQVLVSAKSPDAAMEVIFSAAWPETVNVTVCAALVVPCVCNANVRLSVESVTFGRLIV